MITSSGDLNWGVQKISEDNTSEGEFWIYLVRGISGRAIKRGKGWKEKKLRTEG